MFTSFTGPSPATAPAPPPAKVMSAPQGATEQASASAPAESTSRYVPMSPTRVLDTRTAVGGHRGKAAARERMLLPIVGGVASVPAEATAVVLNITVTEPEAVGFVTAYPDGAALPDTSSLNIEYPGQTVANLVTVGLGTGGVRLFSYPRTHLVADIAGYYLPAATSTSGRLQILNPTRLIDTRAPNAVRFGALAPAGTVDIDVASLGTIARSATAAVLTLTVTQTQGQGFLSAIPKGTPPGTVSNLNVSVAGQTITNQAIVPLHNGWVTIYASMATHVVVDLNGWYSGPSSPDSDEGLFVPLTPARLLDSRLPNLSPRPGIKPGANTTFDVTTAGRHGIPSTGVSAVAANATVTDTNAAGYFTLFAAGLDLPLASNLNAVRPGQTVPNHALVPVSSLGLSFYTLTGAHLLIDVNGYFTGTAATPRDGYMPKDTGPPSDGPHAFLYRMSDGSFARWNPCSTLTYKVNYSGAPSFARTEVARAIAKVEAATGIDLVDLGETDLGHNHQPPAGVKAVIAFVSPEESPSISGIAGLGGGAYYTPWNGSDAYVAQGFVHINETLNFTQGTGPNGLEGLLLHELGHMMGLDHVAHTDEAMYPNMHNLPSLGYGPGDREGMWNLGAAKGCLNVAGSAFSTQSRRPSEALRPDPIAVTRGQLGEGARTEAIVAFCHLGATTDTDQP